MQAQFYLSHKFDPFRRRHLPFSQRSQAVTWKLPRPGCQSYHIFLPSFVVFLYQPPVVSTCPANRCYSAKRKPYLVTSLKVVIAVQNWSWNKIHTNYQAPMCSYVAIWTFLSHDTGGRHTCGSAQKDVSTLKCSFTRKISYNVWYCNKCIIFAHFWQSNNWITGLLQLKEHVKNK